MCIIAAKAAGVQLPTREVFHNMWTRNPDGAGFMYSHKGRVIIEKGFMTEKEFLTALGQFERNHDTTKTPMVFHFRITTHGGTKAENCHPFPVSSNVKLLGKPRQSTDLGVAHNGIISCVSPRKGISDTMEYIATILAPIKSALPKFYRNRDILNMIETTIASKMCFLTKEGNIYTIGDFVEDNGMQYSNTSYKESRYASKYNYYGHYSSDKGGWYDDYDDYDNYFDYPIRGKNWKMFPDEPKKKGTETIEALFLADSDYICDDHGHLVGQDDFYDLYMDKHGKVYQYNYDTGKAKEIEGAQAYTAFGAPLINEYETRRMADGSNGFWHENIVIEK